MKKVLSLLFVTLLALTVWADTTVTVDFSQQGWSTNTQVTELVIDNVKLTFDIGTGSTKPTYYSNTSGSALRLYGGNTMTVTAPQNLKKIDFTFASGEDNNQILSNVGNFNSAKKQWTIGSSDPSKEVVFTIDGNSGHRRIAKLLITMEDAEPVTELVAPEFHPNGGEFSGSLEVTLTCATEDCDIFYWAGGQESESAWIHYNSPFYVTETTTYTAVSTKGGDMSDYVTVTFTKQELTVEAPVFNPGSCSFQDRLDVTLSCATPNAKIYYSLDNELWSEYSDAIPVTDDLTIWAKAKVGDVVSEVVSATYTKLPATTVEVTFDGAVDKGNGDTQRHSYTVVKEPVTMFVGDGTVYSDHYRIYKSDTAAFTFTSAGAPIIKIELNGISGNTPSNLSLAEGQTGTYTTNGTQGIWEGNAPKVDFQINSQVRLYTVVVTLASSETTFERGDADHDGNVTVKDIATIINYLLTDPALATAESDCDLNETVNVRDIAVLINFLLTGEWPE